MKKLFLFLFLGLIFQVSLHAEIQAVTIRWTAQLCQETCLRLLQRELSRVQGVEEVALDQGSGQATLTWNPKIPFQYSSVNTAMRMVGLSIRDIRIKVRGNIQHSGYRFYIVSLGDNTRFELLSPITPVRGGVAVEFNEATRKITSALKQQLLDGETLRQIATIEGPIFMPERHAFPTQIVVDQLSFAEPEKLQQPKHPYK